MYDLKATIISNKNISCPRISRARPEYINNLTHIFSTIPTVSYPPYTPLVPHLIRSLKNPSKKYMPPLQVPEGSRRRGSSAPPEDPLKLLRARDIVDAKDQSWTKKRWVRIDDHPEGEEEISLCWVGITMLCESLIHLLAFLSFLTRIFNPLGVVFSFFLFCFLCFEHPHSLSN